MKNLLFLFAILFLLSCSDNAGNEKKSVPKIPPSEASDAQLDGYYGAVKTVYSQRGNTAAYTADDTWVISDSAEETAEDHYDINGSRISSLTSSMFNDSFVKVNGEQIIIHRYYSSLGISKIKFIDPNTSKTSHYSISGKDTVLNSEKITKYSTNFRPEYFSHYQLSDSTHFIYQYRYSGDTTFSTSYYENGKDTLHETIIILEKDAKGNRTKVLAINDDTKNAEIHLRRYEYYPPVKQ